MTNNSKIYSGCSNKKQCFRPDKITIPSLKYLLESSKEQFQNTGGFNSKINGKWQYIGFSDFCENCQRIGDLFAKNDLLNTHIAILGDNNSQWLQGYFATICFDNVAVPMDKELDSENLLERIDFADCTALLYADDFANVAQAFLAANPDKKAFSFSEIDEILPTLVPQKFPDIDSDKMATIVFSSGTTGLSKGIMLSHRNLCADAEIATTMHCITAKDSGLSMLPPNHSYELVTNIFNTFIVGGIMNINDSLRNVQSNMKKFAPSMLAVVPVILETIKRGIVARARKQGDLKKMQFGMKINRFCRTHGFDIGKTIFKSIHEQFGGQINYIVCGGARLDPEVENFFRDLGFKILQGYGITECSPVISSNTFWQNRTGSVGPILPPSQGKIVDEEVWIKGENVMLGYYKDPEATAAVMDGEWFKTGDIGKFDEDGFLYLLGRKKNIIILSNGENVNPEELEGALSQIDGVEDVLVYEENNCITAEFYLEVGGIAEEIGDNKLQWLQTEVDKINLKMPVYKRVANIKIRDIEFQKTTTHKIIRY